MSAATDEMRSQAYGLCRDYLHGAWQLISADDMLLKPVSGGLSNLLFLCELPRHQTSLNGEPTRVLLRMYGQNHGNSHSSITDSVIFTMLAERRLGPRLYGVFSGGRLEEFIPAASLSLSDLRDPHVSRQIAQKMAVVHSLNVPISKEPTFIWKTMQKWINLSQKYLEDTTLAERANQGDIIKSLRLCNFESEADWLKGYFALWPSPVLFCHNDCQEGNILRHTGTGKPGNDSLTLIDFEYCSYNYRGFDLANHFCEWTFDYSHAEYPFFIELPERAQPSREEQLRFIRAYLRQRDGSASDGGAASGDQEQLAMLDEVRVYTLGSHLFWALWGVVNAAVSTIPFGYWEYAECRLRAYQRLKQRLRESDPRWPHDTAREPPPDSRPDFGPAA